MDTQRACGADRQRWSVETSSAARILSARQYWPYWHAVALLLLATLGCSSRATTDASEGSRHLFVWAWDVDQGADDFLAVVDVDRRSATYGEVVRTLPAPGGRGAHHVEYEMTTSQLFANSFNTGRTFVFDLSDPVRPRLSS